jgi:predicted acetyltransferase
VTDAIVCYDTHGASITGRAAMMTGMSSAELDRYDPGRDLDAVNRLWKEIGWVEDDDDPGIVARWLTGGQSTVARIDGSAECLVQRTPGTIRYQAVDLPLSAVTAVTTSLVARRQGLASRLTAETLTEAAAGGAAVAALGAFDQGFYDRLGFGNGGYQNTVTFDPALLLVDHVPYRTPERLTVADHVDLHSLLQRRHRYHGTVVLDPPELIWSEMEWLSPPIGLGYRSEGRLTHALYGRRKGEHGPDLIQVVAYEEPAQVLELLRLLKELSDQIVTVRMLEPAGLQLQDLLATPLRDRRRTTGSEHATGLQAVAWWQLRILDLAAAIEAHASTGPSLRFNLTLTDPLSLVDGDYVVTIGTDSSIEPGSDPGADRLDASVNAFSRLWFGVGSATSLALTDQLSGSPALLAALDRSLVVPAPVPGLDF